MDYKHTDTITGYIRFQGPFVSETASEKAEVCKA